MAAPHSVPSAFKVRRFDNDCLTSGEFEPRQRTPAFAPLNFQEWKCLTAIAERQQVGPRRSLCVQDELRSSVVAIQTGVVKLVRLEPDGSEFIVGLRSDGWLIDAPSIILNRPAPFTAVTLTPCTVYRASREAFMGLLNRTPDLMWDLARLISREIQAEREQQIELRGGTAQSRLNRLLSELSRSTLGEKPLDLLPLKRLEIAQLLSITPEHLSRLLRG